MRGQPSPQGTDRRTSFCGYPPRGYPGGSRNRLSELPEGHDLINAVADRPAALARLEAALRRSAPVPTIAPVSASPSRQHAPGGWEGGQEGSKACGIAPNGNTDRRFALRTPGRASQRAASWHSTISLIILCSMAPPSVTFRAAVRREPSIKPKGRRLWPLIVVAVIAIGAVAAAGVYWLADEGRKPVAETAIVPNAPKPSIPVAPTALPVAPADQPSKLRTGLRPITIPPAPAPTRQQ